MCINLSIHRSEQVKGTILHFGVVERNTIVPANVQYNGIIYRKGQFVVTKNEDLVEFGKIILVKDDFVLYFLLRVYDGQLISHYHMYTVKKMLKDENADLFMN